jgi:hypothetical protein
MNTRRRLMTAAMAVGLLLPLAATPASAAPPANDEPAGALPLRLGDRVVQDTREATTNAQDEAFNLGCGAPSTAASVWYTYTPDKDRELVLDVTESSYSSGVLVFAGTPSAGSVVSCGPGIVGLRAKLGKTYNIMAFADTGTTGGQLVLSLEKAPPEPRVNVSLAPRGVAFRGGAGAAEIHGTYSCRNGEFAAVSGTLLQRAGRLKVQGRFGTEIKCNGTRRQWSARVISPIGTYVRGHASARIQIFACGVISCNQDKAERDLELAWATNPDRRPAASRPTTWAPRPRPLVELQGHWPGS